MAPDLLNSMDGDELFQSAQVVKLFQDRKKWSDVELLRKFTGLGSTKTYRKILKRDFTEMDVESQVGKYAAVVTLIESLGDAEQLREPLYEDLMPARRLKSAFLDVMKESGDARFVLMLGDSGAGKTCSRRLLIEAFGQRILWTEASEVWADSPMAFLGEVLRACGEKNPPYSALVRLRKVTEHLQTARVCLIVDEGHHLGPRCLNTIKTLLNSTPGEFVVQAMYSLWKRIELEAYQEVKQLVGNRLAERIQLKLEPSDVLKMLQRRIKWADEPKSEDPEFKTAAEKSVKLLMERAPRFGNLAFVREVCKQVNEMAAGESVDAPMFSAALTAKEVTR